MAALKAEADAGRVWCIQDGVRWAEEQHRVTYTYQGMRGVFDHLGLCKKVPRPRDPLGQVRQVWAPRGIKVVQTVEDWREWAYLNSAVNGLTSRLRWDWTENMKGVSLAPVVQRWGRAGVEVVL